MENARGRESNGKDKHIKPNWNGGLMAVSMERLKVKVHESFGGRDIWLTVKGKEIMKECSVTVR